MDITARTHRCSDRIRRLQRTHANNKIATGHRTDIYKLT